MVTFVLRGVIRDEIVFRAWFCNFLLSFISDEDMDKYLKPMLYIRYVYQPIP